MTTYQPSSQILSNERTKTIKDAIAYLDEVKYAFVHKPEIYNKFLELMKKFKLLRCDTHEVINTISELFKDQPQLIVSFTRFLPPNHEIEVELDGFDGGFVLVCERNLSDSIPPVSSTSIADSSDVLNTMISPPVNTSYMSSIGSMLTTVTSIWNALPSIVSNKCHNQ